MLTKEQIRAARALLDWSQPMLAEAAKLSLPTISRMEGALGPSRSTAANVEAVRRAFEDAGVVFLKTGEPSPEGGAGVRLKA
ncbi:transcriptional regulator [Caulobacter radicis]|uniref:helix-turn-helix domain-containing protein n=1 Tax=Caulobacter radicis TaxID=2172650 RepID=UPI000D57FA4A|nr:helix-turn-helix transcriptional regulator [Caulobacter radicis]PVM92152.1 transcriptional regulator [Caulobacter radicis]